MKIEYDPSEGDNFWGKISKIPGYPKGEIKPIQIMLFKSNAIFKTTGTLKAVGAKHENPLILVMDSTPMKRGSDDLKKLVLEILVKEGWQVRNRPINPGRDRSGPVRT